MTLRIAMWSGPRNISTAMMRAFENRPDCEVVDEPFYASYLHSTGIEHPGREAILASQPTDWRQVADALCHVAPAEIFYQKHMTQHITAGMDLGFTEALCNCFLIREPRRIVASYAKIRPQFTLEELGFPQQWQLFQRECDRLGEAPPVLDSALTLADPRAVLSALCERLGINFTDAMLRWPSGPRATDGVWAAHWYEAVWASTGFALPAESGEMPALTSEREALAVEAEGFYERMRVHALGA